MIIVTWQYGIILLSYYDYSPFVYSDTDAGQTCVRVRNVRVVLLLGERRIVKAYSGVHLWSHTEHMPICGHMALYGPCDHIWPHMGHVTTYGPHGLIWAVYGLYGFVWAMWPDMGHMSTYGMWPDMGHMSTYRPCGHVWSM